MSLIFFPPPWMLCRQSAHRTIYQLWCENYHSTIQNSSGYVPTLTSQTQWYFDLKDKDPEKMLDAFQFDNWANVFEQYHDLNETWRRWKEQFLKDVQSFIPSRSPTTQISLKRHHSTHPWFTRDIRSLIRTKNRLFKRACCTKSPDHWETFCKARNKANASVKRAKAAYLTDQARQLADPNCPLANGGFWLRPCVAWAKKFRPTFLPCSLRPMTLFGMITRRRICSMIRLSIKILPLIQRHSLLVQQTLNLSFTLPNYLRGRSEMFQSHYPTNCVQVMMEFHINF